MLISLKVKCDRCKQLIEGSFDDNPSWPYTCGYYAFDSTWAHFMDGAERTVCDACMLKDPRYIKIYRKHLD